MMTHSRLLLIIFIYTLLWIILRLSFHLQLTLLLLPVFDCILHAILFIL